MKFESHIEKQIRGAQERGEFDNLPVAGKPIAGLDLPLDELWWVKDKVRREDERSAGATKERTLRAIKQHLSYLPPSLALLRNRVVEALTSRLKIKSATTRRWVDLPAGGAVALCAGHGLRMITQRRSGGPMRVFEAAHRYQNPRNGPGDEEQHAGGTCYGAIRDFTKSCSSLPIEMLMSLAGLGRVQGADC